MKILVTGADGLLGSNLVRELLGRGHSVKVLLQPGSKSKTLEGLPIESAACDLLGEGGPIAEAMAGCEAVYHCAAITDQWAAPEITWKVNYGGTEKILAACAEAKIRRLIFVGSASSFQFGTMDAPGDETSPFPEVYRDVAYMESKHRATRLVQEKAAAGEISAVVVSPTFLLGPYDSRPSSGELIRQFIVRNIKVSTPGGRNFVYAPDAAVAMANALEMGKSGEVYIMGGENVTYRDFFTKVAEKAGKPPPNIVLPRWVILAGGAAGSLYEKVSRKKVMITYRIARFSLLGTYYNPAKAMRDLKMPKTPLDKAIEDSIESLKIYGHIKADEK